MRKIIKSGMVLLTSLVVLSAMTAIPVYAEGGTCPDGFQLILFGGISFLTVGTQDLNGNDFVCAKQISPSKLVVVDDGLVP